MAGFSRRIGFMFAVGLGLGLGGCSLVPPYDRPPAPVPARYPADVADAGAAGPRDLSWRGYFPDPHLQQLIATALANNRDIKAAALRVEEARALYGVQAGARLPALDLGATGTWPRAAAGNYAFQAGPTVPAFELDFFGKVKSLSGAALHDYLGTEAARRAAEVSLIAEVARIHVRSRAAAIRAMLARQALDSRTAAVALLARRVRAGLSSQLDLRQAQTLIGVAESELAEQQLAQARAANALALLIDYADMPATAAEPELMDRWGTVPAGLPSALLAARPDILAAEERLKAANMRIGAARAAFFPAITLTTMGGLAAGGFGKLFSPGSAAWQFSPQLTLPIFDGGRNEANLDLAKVRRELAVTEYEKTIQVAFREVADALAGQALLERDLAARIDTRDTEAQRLELTRRRYLAGTIGYLDVLDAERSLFAAEQNLVEARRARLENAVDLYRALGGGCCNPAAAAAAPSR